MPKLKSERHHWWPECVSEFWKDATGRVTRLTPDGEILTIPPKNFGVIQNGHLIRLASDPNAYCPWDESYEHAFNDADRHFADVISWLHAVPSEDRREGVTLRQRFIDHQIDDEMVRKLIECLVSLAVRCPMTRERAVAAAEHFRGKLHERERNGLIGLNLRHFHKDVVRNIDGRGKIAVLFSPDREFIFGDGFYHNLTAPPMPPHCPVMVVPLTPTMTVIYARPMSNGTDPRFVTMVITPEEASALNDAVQIYSAKMLFYRNERPTLLDSFRLGRHQIYASSENSIDYLIHGIPGIRDRDRRMETWLKPFAARG